MDVIANGVRLQYVEAGKGPPVICIHGNGLNTQLWRHLIPKLSGRYRTVAYDLRGMGQSEATGRRGVTVTNDDHAKDLESLMDSLNIEQAGIVGHAFGGFVALRAAINWPDRIKAMVLTNTSAGLDSPTAGAIPRWIRVVDDEGMEPLVDEAMSRWFTERVHREQPELIQLYREIVGANPPMGYAANCRGILEYDVRAELGKIQCPTLLIAGEKDWSTPPKDHELIASQVTDGRFVVVPDASHTVPEEKVEEFNRMTLEFLDSNL